MNNITNIILTHQNQNRIEKVMAPQSKGGQELKKTNTKCYKDRFLNTDKILCMLLYYY
jgi:hypothetical protein